MAHFNYTERLEKLLARTGLDVIALVPGPNMVYYTGLEFHLSERPTVALVSKHGLSFILPELEVSKLQERADLETQAFAWGDGVGFHGAFQRAVAELGLSQAQVGVDGQTMRVFEWLAFAQAGLNVNQVQDRAQDILMVRAYKSAEEIALMRSAIALSEEALRRTVAWVQVGMSEVQIVDQLNRELQTLGTEGLAFESIILTGPRSALPHGVSGSRPLQADEFLLIDFGGKKAGYPADITRTFCLGTPSAEMRRIHDTVRFANEAALKKARPGVTSHEVDKAARDVIEAAGYGKLFTHRTGHGLGLSGHELPNIAPNNSTVLEEGMVFTIEPGIYHPELGGVRIEDDAVITANGCESLTTYPKAL